MDSKTFLADRQRVMEAVGRVISKQGDTVDLRLQPAQVDYLRRSGRLNLVPKARQLGMTTIGFLDDLVECWTYPNTNFLLLVQSDDDVAPTTGKLLYLNNEAQSHIQLDDGVLQLRPKIERDSDHLIKWANGSQALIRTANSKSVGRSLAFHRVHGTEVAFWDDREAERVIAAVLGASGAIERFKCTLESTGNGPTGLFYRLCDKARQGAGDWQLLFYNWLWASEYSLDGEPLGALTEYEQRLGEFRATEAQIRWWRQEYERFKVLGKGDEFFQEYPLELKDCFQSLGVAVFTEDEKIRVGRTVKDPLTTSADGGTRVWEKAIAGHGYIITGAPSSGTADDPAAATVYDARARRHVATVEAWYEPHVLAQILYDLGVKYNMAYIRVERNGGYGQSVGRELVEKLGYPNAEFGDDGHFGITTSAASKARLVSEFKEALATGEIETPDQRVLDEMTTFTRRQGKMGSYGKREHDDVLMCLMNAVDCSIKNPQLARGGGTRIIRLRG